jgi:hypothetical protein
LPLLALDQITILAVRPFLAFDDRRILCIMDIVQRLGSGVFFTQMLQLSAPCASLRDKGTKRDCSNTRDSELQHPAPLLIKV